MKTNRFKTLVAGIVTGMLLFSGCTKEGPIGPQGQPGLNGVANIQTSFVTVNTADWNYAQNGNYWYADFTGFGTISDNAAILVYIVDNTSTNDFISMPVTFTDLQYYYKNGPTTIELDVSSASGNTPISTTPPPTTNYKIVVIPPAMIKKNVNHKDYAEVTAAYGIKD